MTDDSAGSAQQMEEDNVGLLGGDDVRTGLVVLSSGETRAVQYAAVDGLAVFEGDIVLGTVDEMESATAQLSGRAQAGDDVAHGVVHPSQSRRWPNALMPYEIDPAVTNGEARVAAAIQHWEQNTHMRFVRRTSANASQYPNYVRVIRGDGCWSKVGMRGGKQELSLADGCGFGAAVHEFGHAWGIWHEQSREDRDGFVTIRWANITSGKEHNFNQHISDGNDVGAYDYGSIMHYGRFAFSKNGQPTITPKQSGVTIGQRSGLSAGDIATVHHMYRLWHTHMTVAQTYATSGSKNAWVNLVGMGWRRIDPNASDGVTDVFAQAVWARAEGRKLTVYADGRHIYRAYML
ncbi:Dot/Icm T4SS effector Zinc-dependent metalloprotease LegP [Isoptericola haloaureus]|uniref:Dot/Icm T4SS effector Zinc-dependent metalloprotease LegP n=1 Tax=Isoptericola haloaureus TaxID=1542902 RepID=A0ABU7Z2L5_9MICO